MSSPNLTEPVLASSALRRLCAFGILLTLACSALALWSCDEGRDRVVGCEVPQPQGVEVFVLDPSKVHYGASFSEWSVRWRQWANEIPLDNHPLFDMVGTDAAVGQVDPVWFIGGVFGELAVPTEATAERTITIPSGVALFFPIVNVTMDNGGCLPDDWGPDKSSTELRRLAFELVNAVGHTYCYVDGVQILDADDLAGAVEYRAIAAEFSAWMPYNHIYVGLCGDPPGEQLVTPISSDGIWMMLAPMPPGEHTIRFGGEFPEYGPFIIDIVYHITVLP